MHCVILAGGSGTRFWPKSRRKRPKQLLNLINGSSLIDQTVKRLTKYPNCEGIYAVASQQIVDLIRANTDAVADDNYFVEPSPRNTAPAVALAAFILNARLGPDAVMGVFPADHLVNGNKAFFQSLKLAETKAGEGANLVTLGIQPSHPATGYGYIEFDRSEKGDVHKVVRFTEKPDLETAKQFLEGGEHLWNGGMFVWKVGSILENIAEYLPATWQNLLSLEDLIDGPEFYDALDEIWPVVDSISIDYGVLERAQSIYTIETRFDWNDLGSWRTLYQVLPKDSDGNVSQGDVTLIDSKNTLVVSEDRYTAVVGAEDMIVVSMDDATIVLPRSQSERVGEIVHWLKTHERKELL